MIAVVFVMQVTLLTLLGGCIILALISCAVGQGDGQATAEVNSSEASVIAKATTLQQDKGIATKKAAVPSVPTPARPAAEVTAAEAPAASASSSTTTMEQQSQPAAATAGSKSTPTVADSTPSSAAAADTPVTATTHAEAGSSSSSATGAAASTISQIVKVAPAAEIANHTDIKPDGACTLYQLRSISPAASVCRILLSLLFCSSS